MKRFSLPPIAAGMAALMLMGGCAASGEGRSPLPAAPTPTVTPAPTAPPTPYIAFLDTIYYDRASFYGGVGGACDYRVEGSLVAGMIPHHLLASDMIAGFFKAAAKQPAYDGILIVSPSHFPENTNSMAVTAKAGWSTPMGTVQPYTELIDKLLADKVLGAENNPAAVELDHGGAGLVPFVKYYFPDTPLAVCLLQGKLPRERIAAFWEIVGEQRKEANILVVSSADCSHYLLPKEAAGHDEETIKAIESGAQEAIFFFDDENIDSPQSVNTFLEVTKQAGARAVQLDHSSSDKKLPHNILNPIFSEGTTTYLVYAGVVKAP
ncbi:MAG: AmmeMemoRadiSam system protein B [Angelakisella sp.]